jgi:hypothetical protein
MIAWRRRPAGWKAWLMARLGSGWQPRRETDALGVPGMGYPDRWDPLGDLNGS